MAKKGYANKKLKSYADKSIKSSSDTKVMFVEQTHVAGRTYSMKDGWVKGLSPRTIEELKKSPFAKADKILFSK